MKAATILNEKPEGDTGINGYRYDEKRLDDHGMTKENLRGTTTPAYMEGNDNVNDLELAASNENAVTDNVDQQPPGYRFTSAKKNFILLQITIATALVFLTQSTILPAMPLMQEGLHTTPTTINATVSIGAYMYGIFPAVWATYADGYGRRWIYIISLLMAALGNVGTALSTNISVLFISRIITAAGGSSLLSTGVGTLADVFPAAERGRTIALYAAVPFFVPTFGPVAGGAIVEHFGWRGLFWALAIVAFAIWLMLLLFLPETSPRTNVAPVSFRDKMLTNPFASLKLLGYPNVLMVSIYSGVLMFVANSIETSFSWVYSKQYGLDATTVGACYLPSAFGALIGCVGTGLLSDRRFKKNETYCKKTGITYYPEMRLGYDIMLVATACAVAGYTAYGWLVQANVSYVFGMIVVFFGRFGALVLGCITTIYMTEAFNSKGASASDIFRNMIGATGTLTSVEMQKTMGPGLYATTCAVFLFAFSVLLPLTVMNAAKWKRMRDRE